MSILVISHSLVGCAAAGRSLDRMFSKEAIAERQQAFAQAESQRMERECITLGFKSGTNEMNQCKLMLEVQKRNAAANAAAIYNASPEAKKDCQKSTLFRNSPLC